MAEYIVRDTGYPEAIKDIVGELVRCGKCRHYQGNHDVPGCAPCAFWGIGGVMWDDFCKRGERYDSD